MKIETKSISVLLFFLCLFPAFGFKFSPISMDFSSTGQKSVRNFTATNDTAETIALKVTVFKRSMAIDGSEILEAVENDFVVFPARMVLKPEGKQIIRVQYRGADIAGMEKAYRIIVEQVPVQFEENESSGGLRILFRYVGSMYIIPEKLKTDAIIEEIIDDSDDETMSVLLRNTGNSHVILQDLTITLSSGGKTVILGPDELPDLSGSNLLAGSMRRYSFGRPDIPEGEVTGELSFIPVR